MKQPQNLFLVGPMGAGKSAVGRQIAKFLHLSFVDSDEEIESRTGVDIPFIFEKEGEEGFRKREAKERYLRLGGIYETERRETVTKVPFLGDIPFVGALFRSKQRTDNKAELLIFVTPRILAEGSSIY